MSFSFWCRILASIATLASASVSLAQSLSPEDISKMVEERIGDLNPYQALLNDPDPARSLAAMQIMMESGDSTLTRMAMEFGLLSPNPTVKRTALEGWLTTGPVLSIRFDGSKVKDNDFPNIIRSNWDGALDGNTGYWRIAVAGYLPEKKCFTTQKFTNDCFITINSDGVFLTAYRLNARASLTDLGTLEGTGSMSAVDEPVPFTIQLVD